MNIGLKIRRMAEERKINIMDIVKYTGKSRSTVYNYLEGKTSIDIETLIKISELLKVPISEFFDEIQGYKDEKSKRLQEALELIETQKKLIAMLEEKVVSYKKKQKENEE